MRIPARLLTIAILLIIVSSSGFAQYLEEREYDPSHARMVNLGFVDREFMPRYTNTAPDSMRIHYDRIMPMIGFRQGLVDLAFGYARFDRLGASRTTIFFGAGVSNEFVLAGRSQSVLALPVMASADFTKAESGLAERDDFNVASVGLGAGLKYRYLSGGLDFSATVMEIAHYSLEGLSTGTGFSAATTAEALLTVRDLGPFEGLAFGYRFRLQTWSMNVDRLDYRVFSHGPYLGVLF